MCCRHLNYLIYHSPLQCVDCIFSLLACQHPDAPLDLPALLDPARRSPSSRRALFCASKGARQRLICLCSCAVRTRKPARHLGGLAAVSMAGSPMASRECRVRPPCQAGTSGHLMNLRSHRGWQTSWRGWACHQTHHSPWIKPSQPSAL